MKVEFNTYPSETARLRNMIGEELWQLFTKHRCIIAGGAITSLFTNNEVNDIDVYFRNQNDVLQAVHDIFDDSGPVSILPELEEAEFPWSLVCTNYTDKSILFCNRGGEEELKCQFIYYNYFQSCTEIFESFDFTVCMGAYDFSNQRFVMHEDFIKHNAQRHLSYNSGTTYPLLSTLRVDKYVKKGYSISKTEYLRAVLNTNKVVLDSWEKVKEHVGGFYGYDVENFFDEERECTTEEIIKQLSETNKPLLKTKGVQEVSKALLISAIKKEPPRWYKTVSIRDGRLYSTHKRDFEYVVGDYVNGGEMGVFADMFDSASYFARPNGKNTAIIELVPKMGKYEKSRLCGYQLYGDVYVKQIINEGI